MLTATLLSQANGVKKAKAALASGGGPKKPAVERNPGPTPLPALQLDGWEPVFKGYNLAELQIPKEAYPQDRPNLGKHGYTLVSPYTGGVL